MLIFEEEESIFFIFRKQIYRFTRTINAPSVKNNEYNSTKRVDKIYYQSVLEMQFDIFIYRTFTETLTQLTRPVYTRIRFIQYNLFFKINQFLD